jgi:Sec-independent protein translocase protein TatA
VGFGIEIIFVLMLGLLILGPQRLHTMLGHMAQAKAEFERASRGFKSQLAAELEAAPLQDASRGVEDACNFSSEAGTQEAEKVA